MYQKITIAGNLGRDPEMRFTPKGTAITSFSVATNRSYTGNNGEKVNEVTWFDIAVWGNQAEACNQYLKKGSKVLVEGRLVPDKDTGNPVVFQRKDGSSGAKFEINASDVRFLDSKEESQEVRF